MDMIEIFSDLLEIVFRILTATIMSVLLVRFSPLLFNFDPVSEIKKGNMAGGVALSGLVLLTALIAGLFKL